MGFPATPAPRADLLLPLPGLFAGPPARPGYVVLERLDVHGRVEQRGVLGALSLHGTESGHILRHQQVGEPEVRLHTRLLRERRAPAEPLLLAAPDPGAFRRCIDETVRRPPDRTGPATRGGTQRLWAVAGEWSRRPPALPPVLLADGHHRLEAARRLHRGQPARMGDRLPALVVDHGRYPLRLAATHRTMPGLDPYRAADVASGFARVTELPAGSPRPVPRAGTFLLTGKSRIWAISRVSPVTTARRLRFLPSEWAELSAAISDHVLIPILCEDQGLDPTPGYTERHPADDEAGLILPPPTWEQIWSGAAGGTVMPPRTTSLGPAPLPGLLPPLPC
ncbi:DUF1015 domain-containing protein [Streptomyces sp. JH002]|uniref:DUF1015 family protein n=1 Tax=Streptomyces xiamenensis TaxID=408015 RepID=A0A0F7FS42_9ACTN|nr:MULTISPECIES: DUF1015 family protein [Streptomyces]AKG43127.1 hypothetical protein SXIM_17430 [Streptomyces xiamenensis]MCU4745771.1 DUF1015 domain-containing protein [Streptomyces sp. G-5]QQN79265.1 DUF1015 family protein [Streptomyces sp. XC 2026]